MKNLHSIFVITSIVIILAIASKIVNMMRINAKKGTLQSHLYWYKLCVAYGIIEFTKFGFIVADAILLLKFVVVNW